MAERKAAKGRKKSAPQTAALKIPPPNELSIRPPSPRAAASLAVAEGAAPPVQTVVYCSGLQK